MPQMDGLQATVKIRENLNIPIIILSAKSEDTDKILSDYGVLKVSKGQQEMLDKKYLLYKIQTDYGFELLTNEKQYYADNYPDCVIEKGSVDQVIRFITKGVAV